MVKRLSPGQKAKKTRLAKSPQSRAHDTMNFKTRALRARITTLRTRVAKLEQENKRLKAKLSLVRNSKRTKRTGRARRTERIRRSTVVKPAPVLASTPAPVPASTQAPASIESTTPPEGETTPAEAPEEPGAQASAEERGQ